MEISKEKRRVYNKTFINKHKDDKFTCDICNKEYSIFNKSHHYDSNKHIINKLKAGKIDSLEDLKQSLKSSKHKINAPPPSPRLSECAISTDTEISSDFK